MAAAIAPRPRLAQPKLVGWIWDREFQNETHLLREDGLKILFEEWVRIILISMFQPQFESVLYFWSIFGSSVNMFINLRSLRLDRLNRNKAKVVGPMEAMYKWRLQIFWFFYLLPPSQNFKWRETMTSFPFVINWLNLLLPWVHTICFIRQKPFFNLLCP